MLPGRIGVGSRRGLVSAKLPVPEPPPGPNAVGDAYTWPGRAPGPDGWAGPCSVSGTAADAVPASGCGSDGHRLVGHDFGPVADPGVGTAAEAAPPLRSVSAAGLAADAERGSAAGLVVGRGGAGSVAGRDAEGSAAGRGDAGGAVVGRGGAGSVAGRDAEGSAAGRGDAEGAVVGRGGVGSGAGRDAEGLAAEREADGPGSAAGGVGAESVAGAAPAATIGPLAGE